jgi:endonuclease-3
MKGVEVGPSLRRRPRRGEIRRIRRIARILEGHHGPKVWTKGDDPLSQLVKTILSQNTTDTNSLRAFQSLRGRFPAWSQVHKASIHRIADAIHMGGLAQIKARRIKGILAQICQEHGHCDLSFLAAWPTGQIRDFLAQFTGVGEKTIACVLLFSLGRSVMPVDTHVLRVSKRLGLIPSKADANRAHQLLQATVPEDLVYSVHLNLIQHGRTICKARNPACERCALCHECPAYPIFQAQRG